MCRTRLQPKSASNTAPRQSTLCQCENTHELYVKIVLLSSKNVNRTSQHRGRCCLGGVFPQQAEQFMSEFKTWAWTGSSGLHSLSPSLTCGPRGQNVKAQLPISSWPPPPKISSPWAGLRVPVSLHTNMTPIWPASRTQVSQWRQINLSTRRCQAGDSCWLHFQQMSAVAKLQWTWAGHLLDAFYTHSKYFLKTLIWDQNFFVAPHTAAAFRSWIYNIWGARTEDRQHVKGAEPRNNWKNPFQPPHLWAWCFYTHSHTQSLYLYLCKDFHKHEPAPYSNPTSTLTQRGLSKLSGPTKTWPTSKKMSSVW